MMEEFETVSDRHLGQISITKHRTKLAPGLESPVLCAQYRAGPDKRKLKKL